ncbi:hypothetical protein NM688_g8316 [Phlebia brevispora]|uniref:Uncharacterized protein n=1 Tax=Phlebia brevispora TaxID=194682 RepID=A0ACC1RUH1_9APHY|nr:hypothetical protein NM688_g8316 [Phlebia brevispora]
MSNFHNGKDEDEMPPPQRPPSPPPHTTFAARGLHPPVFSAFKPRDIRMPSPQAMNHVAWNCDGRRLAAVGIDKVVRIWQPEKSMELRSASMFSGGHSDDVDYISWNPTHPDLFSPLQTTYSPDGKSLLYTTTGRQMFIMTYGKEGEEVKEQWHVSSRDPLNISRVIFNHAGDCILGSHYQDAVIRIYDYPGLNVLHHTNSHVGGCTATVLDPRGRYMASGGQDTIVNLYDVSDWICVRTITCSEYPTNALSFSHDGEFIAIASQGPYIDICATETGAPLHRIPALGPAQTVAWHPSKYVIAYCGQTERREGGPPVAAWISLFGPGM